MHEEGVYTCTIKDCEFRSNLRHHVLQHNNTDHPEIAQASVEKSIRRQASIESGGRVDSSREMKIKTIICMTCSEDLETKAHLNEHNKNVHQILEYPCFVKDCKESFACKEQLNKHVELKHKSPLNCAYCSNCFQKNSDLHQHVRLEHQKGEFICQSCKLSLFSTQAEFEDHWKGLHAPKFLVKKLFCPENGCNKEFPYEKEETKFLNHLNQEHNIKKYLCFYENCGHSFDQM